jgi:hypothetical protein
VRHDRTGLITNFQLIPHRHHSSPPRALELVITLAVPYTLMTDETASSLEERPFKDGLAPSAAMAPNRLSLGSVKLTVNDGRVHSIRKEPATPWSSK